MGKLEDYLTVAECAAALGCNPSTVHRWLESGLVKHTSRFGKRLIRRRDCKRPDKLQGRINFGKAPESGGEEPQEVQP